MLQITDLKLDCSAFDKYITRYSDPDIPTKARILYFHGGGLLYGSRKDLPKQHIETLTSAGYEILAFDYPLAPAAGLEIIVDDVCSSINHACENECPYTDSSLPYFLWGRSAGAYLCLLAAAGNKLNQTPKGILSYYGYGFLCDDWFCSPSTYYQTLPTVPSTCLSVIPGNLHTEGNLDTHYSVYVYARQTGEWKNLIYKGREKFFYLNYSLRLCDHLPCPLFAAHSTGDTDVPYAEFMELCSRYQPTRFIASGTVHDFDRDVENPLTEKLLNETLLFLKQHSV